MAMDSKEIDATLALLLSLEYHQNCFARNLFRNYMTTIVSDNKDIIFREAKFTADETKFLMFFFDYIHNIPELIKHLIHLKNGSVENINEVLAQINIKSLTNLSKLIRDEGFKEYGIKPIADICDSLIPKLKNKFEDKRGK